MRLGVVGHAQEKFRSDTEHAARQAIAGVAQELGATTIVSGHSPMGGVDWYAEEYACARGLELQIFKPDVNQWDPPGRYGFKARNLDIARHSDCVLVVVVVETLPPDFEGQTFGPRCYHCRWRVPAHIKSGAYWTAWRCRTAIWKIIAPDKSLTTTFRKSGDQDPGPRQEDPATAEDPKGAGNSPSHTQTHGEQ